MYVVQDIKSGRYLARGAFVPTYTDRIWEARTFATKLYAKREAGYGERVVRSEWHDPYPMSSPISRRAELRMLADMEGGGK